MTAHANGTASHIPEPTPSGERRPDATPARHFSIVAMFAGLASILGVVSTAIGIYATVQNTRLKAVADEQANLIADRDAQIRARADTRAETAAERDYAIKVFDKAIAALEGGDPKRQRVALALIATLPDPMLRERLSGAFQASSTVDDAGVREYAQQVQQQARADIRNIDVFWCTAQPKNEAVASRLYSELSNAERGRLRQRRWTEQENASPGYQVRGLEIRAEINQMEEASQLKSALDRAAGAAFTIKTVKDRPPNFPSNYLSVFVCMS